MSSRRPPAPPPRSGKLFWLLAVLLNVAVPGVGHIYAQLLVRGFMYHQQHADPPHPSQGDVPLAGLLGALGALRAACVADLVYLLRSEPGAGPDWGTPGRTARLPRSFCQRGAA